MSNITQRRRGGQALLAVTFSLIFLFAAMGLSIDLGSAYYLKTRVQTAADAAASAAAVYAKNNADTCSNITCGVTYNCAGVTPPTNSLQAGCLYATSDAPPTFTATMIENNTTPPGVTGNSPAMWVKATVSTSAPNFFLFGAGFHVSSIAAQSISAVTSVPPTSCIYVLDPSASGALTMTGSSALSASNCDVYVNSSDTAAVTRTGSSTISCSAGHVKVVGGCSQTGSGSISPAPVTGSSTISDPLSALPTPSFSGCDHWNYSTSSNATLDPGVYCDGISITGSGTITMHPGNYIINGGGMSCTGSANITGSHVMIYNTAVGSHTIGPISLTGSGTYNISAPNAGNYTGVVIYQDRNYSTAASVSGSTSSAVTGTLYCPKSHVTFTGSSSNQYTAIVCKTLTMTGSTAIQNDTSGSYTGLCITKAALIQ